MNRANPLLVSMAIAGIALSIPSAKSQTGYAPVARLTASDGVRKSAVSESMAASGDTVVMGETCIQFNPDCSAVEEAVYVYEKPSSGWQSMVQVAKLTPSDGFPGDHFGNSSVAVSGDTIVVGGEHGNAYVYVKPTLGWTDMTETAQLLVTAPKIDDYIPEFSASIDKDTIVIGDLFATVDGVPGAGAAFVFEKPSTGWATTSKYAAELTPSEQIPYGFFGDETAINGNTVVVSYNSQPNDVYLFQKTSSGWKNATQTAILSRSIPPTPTGFFGDELAVSGDTVVVGAPAATAPDGSQGLADIFVMPAGGWVDTTETAELSGNSSNFANSVAFDGNRIVVGTFGGQAAFVYNKPSSGGWQTTSHANATLTEASGTIGLFGMPVAIANEAIVVSDWDATVNGRELEGASYVFVPAPMIDYSSGFASASGLSLNGSAELSGTSLELTDGGKDEAGSAFHATPLGIGLFATRFDFQLTHARGDGFTFTIQNTGPDALGSLGGSLGYRHIHKSVAIKFDLYNNDGEGSNSIGIYRNGISPTTPSIDLTSSGIDLHSGDRMTVTLAYDGKALSVSIIDYTTFHIFSTTFPIDIPAAVGGDTAYVGFTGGTGGSTATQDILSWTFQ